MIESSGRTRAAAIAGTVCVLVACGGSAVGGPETSTTTGVGQTTTAVTQAPTSPASSSTTIAPSTTAPSTSGPSTTTTTTTTTSTGAGGSTTSTTPDGEPRAEGSGCSPGPGDLPDGRWFGFVEATLDDVIQFDLACWFTGDAATVAAAEDGEESPPPNDYYVRNVNPELRTVPVGSDLAVEWYPEGGNPNSAETVPYLEWVSARADQPFAFGVWIETTDGVIVDMSEQWVP